MNRMMKTIKILLALVALLALPAQAGYVWWMLDFDTAGTDNPWTDDSTSPYVWVVASTDPVSSVGGTRLTNTGGGTGMMMEGDQSASMTAFDLTGYDNSAWTFYMEMGMSVGMADFATNGLTYDQLVQMGVVKSAMDPTEDIWNGAMMVWSPTHGIPEPTSGMLLLVGGALLALRRRRRQRQDGLGEQCNQCNQKVQFDS